MHISKHAIKALPKVSEENTILYMDYVQAVLTGKKKKDIFKELFPEEYKIAVDRADGNTRVVNANVKKAINALERRKDVKEMFATAHKHAWIGFLEKKNKLFENLYGMALDDNVIPRDRINASKVMLEHMPQFQEDINIKVEVKQTKEDFVMQLKEMQRSLQKTATQDAIEVEVND